MLIAETTVVAASVDAVIAVAVVVTAFPAASLATSVIPVLEVVASAAPIPVAAAVSDVTSPRNENDLVARVTPLNVTLTATVAATFAVF